MIRQPVIRRRGLLLTALFVMLLALAALPVAADEGPATGAGLGEEAEAPATLKLMLPLVSFHVAGGTVPVAADEGPATGAGLGEEAEPPQGYRLALPLLQSGDGGASGAGLGEDEEPTLYRLALPLLESDSPVLAAGPGRGK